MFDTITETIGWIWIAMAVAFAATLVVGLIVIFSTAIRLGQTGSSQIRRINYVWFQRAQRVFWGMYGFGLLYLALRTLRPD